MEQITNLLKIIVNTMDQHEGMVAMLGIAVTVLIFRREVSNNYFTMEKDNFNDIFKDFTLKELPEKIDNVEQSTKDDWDEKFAELMDVLEQILIDAKYYKYSIPFFYECLRLRVDEIRDLERHENWRLYRNAVKQNRLIQKKCSAIIRNINNASKGRIFCIKCYQNRFNQRIRKSFSKNFMDHPTDRITEMYVKKSLDKIRFESCDGQEVNVNCLKKMNSSKLIIKNRTNEVRIVDAKCIESRDVYFGYFLGIRFKRKIGKIVIKAKKDKNSHVLFRRNQVHISLADTNVHKVILIWTEGDDREHRYFNVFNIKKK